MFGNVFERAVKRSNEIGKGTNATLGTELVF
jgi:hypothetical protein